MANPSPQETEILVHITAPSRATDDVAYRQLAQAYLDFQPAERTRIQLAEPQIYQHNDGKKKQASEQAPVSSNQFPTSSPVQPFEINSQDISFRSALDNRSSPRLRYTAAKNAATRSSQESGVRSQVSWCPPSSEISDSYPVPEAGLLQVSPSRVLRHYIGRPSTEQRDRSSSSPSRKRKLPTPSDSTRVDVPSSLLVSSNEHASFKGPSYARTLVIAGTPPTSNCTKQATITKEAEGTDEPSTSKEVGDIPPDITHISSSGTSNQSAAISSRAESEPPLSKRPKVSQLQHADLIRSSSDTGPALTPSNPALDKINSSLEIRPPSPPVGVNEIDPDDMVPVKFAKLANDLSSRYRPLAKRAIDPFERGYWLLDCSTWSPDSRFGSWVFLNNYLRSELAGWGTWCRRDQTRDWIRLYCWGHVAKHTYLLLYLASERHLKMTGAGWYDADGELVLEVPPHEKQG
ncbi:Fc.00g068210.m01.CDS01 [Cosmosporella sp. VM-42]